MKVLHRLVQAGAGPGRQVQRQLMTQAAGGRQPAEDHMLDGGTGQEESRADFTRISGANAQSASTGTHRPPRQGRRAAASLR